MLIMYLWCFLITQFTVCFIPITVAHRGKKLLATLNNSQAEAVMVLPAAGQALCRLPMAMSIWLEQVLASMQQIFLTASIRSGISKVQTPSEEPLCPCSTLVSLTA